KHTWKSLILRTALICFSGSLALVLIYSFMPVYVTPLMVLRWAGMQKTWVPLEQISPNIQRAVLKAEDYRFYEHSGFDFDAIDKAMQYNKTHQRKKGASTISQQTAKNLSPSQAAMMAAVLPNPNRFRIDRPSSYVLSRQRRILYRVAPTAPKPEEASLGSFFEDLF